MVDTPIIPHRLERHKMQVETRRDRCHQVSHTFYMSSLTTAGVSSTPLYEYRPLIISDDLAFTQYALPRFQAHPSCARLFWFSLHICAASPEVDL